MSKISFIIQGPTSRTFQSKFKNRFLDFFKELKKNGEVILSTYKNEPVNEFNDIADHIVHTTPFYRHKPGFYFSIYNQFESSLNGGLLAKNDFCIKFRTDEFYSNLNYILSKVDKNKLLCSNIHFINPEYRKIRNYTEEFRASDHIFGAERIIFNKMLEEVLDSIGFRDQRQILLVEKLKKLKDSPEGRKEAAFLIENNTVQSPEGVIYKAFVHVKNISLRDKNYFSALKDYLSVVDIRKCSPYIWGMKGIHYTHLEDVAKIGSDYIVDDKSKWQLATVEAGHEDTYVFRNWNLADDEVYYKEWITEEMVNENLHTGE